MASKAALNAKNLEALGEKRLAQLLLDVTKGNAEAKRRLRLELAGEAGVETIAAEVRKRIRTLEQSTSFVEWNKTKALIADLETQLGFITGKIAEKDPAVAFELIWEFVALSNPTYARVDDSNGRVQEVFHGALDDIVELAARALPSSTSVAQHIIAGLPYDEWGYYAPLISDLGAYLKDDGFSLLQDYMESDDGRALPDYTRHSVLSMIADARNDIDAFIALQSDGQIEHPEVAAYSARKLIEVGRAEEALAILERVDKSYRSHGNFDCELAKVGALKALGRHDEAQIFRWSCFEANLNPDHLKAYLSELPDFDDIEAETKAIETAKSFPDFRSALTFLINWKAHEAASEMAIARNDEINGDHYYILTPAANALDGKFSLAATLLRRAMISFALDTGRYSRYKHAARHLLECESSAYTIPDFRDFPDHEGFVDELRREHGKKSSFWAAVGV